MTCLIECDHYIVRPGTKGRFVLEVEGVSDTSSISGKADLPRLTKKDVALRLGVTVPTVERWMRAKRNPIPYRKLGKLVRFHAHEIDDWTASDNGAASRHARAKINIVAPRKSHKMDDFAG